MEKVLGFPTSKVSKHLAKIGGETIISRIINLLAKNNNEEIIFPLECKKNSIINF